MGKARKTKIVTYEKCKHEFLRDNEFIKSGYRMNFDSTKKIMRSLFMFHNESFNVWSHLIGVLLFVLLLGYTVIWLEIPSKVSELHLVDDLKSGILSSLNDLTNNAYRYESMIEEQLLEIYKEAYILGQEFETKIIEMYDKLKSGNTTEKFRPLINKLENIITKIDSKEFDWIDMRLDYTKEIFKVSRWPIFVFIASAMICLTCSSVFHLFSAHSLMMNRRLSTLDYAGISILIAGSFYPPIYYTFYCFPGIFLYRLLCDLFIRDFYRFFSYFWHFFYSKFPRRFNADIQRHAFFSSRFVRNRSNCPPCILVIFYSGRKLNFF